MLRKHKNKVLVKHKTYIYLKIVKIYQLLKKSKALY